MVGECDGKDQSEAQEVVAKPVPVNPPGNPRLSVEPQPDRLDELSPSERATGVVGFSVLFDLEYDVVLVFESTPTQESRVGLSAQNAERLVNLLIDGMKKRSWLS